jgi:hypothetical protein
MNLQRPRVLNFTNRVAKIVSEKGTAALKSYRLPHIGFDRKEVCTWAQVMLKQVVKHLELNFETRALGDTVGFSEVI